jgi:hypothetical protein
VASGGSGGIHEFAALATTGYAEYTDKPGHFLNEILPRLVHLDTFLPLDVPLLWPLGSIPEELLDWLRGIGVVSRERELILTDQYSHGRALFRAQRLYFYGTSEPLRLAPTITWFSQMYLAERVRAALAAREAAAAEAPAARPTILILGRSGAQSRLVSNLPELQAALAESFPAYDQVEFTPASGKLADTVAKVRSAAVILSSHGAGLNNILFARRGTAVIEIGFLQSDFTLPSDYMCLARQTGLYYWLVLPNSGGYGGDMTVNIGNVLDTVTEALQTVGKMRVD